jgi:hypothetical protein
MTRILVLGTVPPFGGPRAEALRQLVADHLAMGDHVEIWSQSELAAAHVHEPRTGLALLARLATRAPRFDALVLRFQPGWPFHGEESRAVRAAFFAGLGVVVRRLGDVTVLLDSPIAIPGGVGGRPTRELWSKASVVVETEADRTELLAIPWLDPSRVTVSPPPPDGRTAALPGWPKPDTADLRSVVMDVVRARAVAGRRLRRSGEEVLARHQPPVTTTAGPTGRTDLPARPEPELSLAFQALRAPTRSFRRVLRPDLATLVARKVLRRLRALLR